MCENHLLGARTTFEHFYGWLLTRSSLPSFHLLLGQLVKDLLTSLPAMFAQSRETHSALGPALQAAFKLMSPTGGRITVFQTQLPTLGAGALQSREDPNQRSSTKASARPDQLRGFLTCVLKCSVTQLIECVNGQTKHLHQCLGLANFNIWSNNVNCSTSISSISKNA